MWRTQNKPHHEWLLNLKWWKALNCQVRPYRLRLFEVSERRKRLFAHRYRTKIKLITSDFHLPRFFSHSYLFRVCFPLTRPIRRHKVLHHRLPFQELSEAAGQVRHSAHRVEQPPHRPPAQREDQRHHVAEGKGPKTHINTSLSALSLTPLTVSCFPKHTLLLSHSTNPVWDICIIKMHRDYLCSPISLPETPLFLT